MAESERLTFICPKWLKDELKQAADDKGISMSEFIKDSLKSILDREKQSKTNAD
jgi:hypothetical protein